MQRSKHLARGLMAGIFLTVVLHASAAEEPGDGMEARGGPLSDVAAEDDSIDWSDWRPSVSVELGFYSHETQASMNACFLTSVSETVRQGTCPTRKGNVRKATWPLKAEESRRVDMATVPVTLELMGPALKGVPGEPRPFIYFGYAFPREGKQLVAIDLSDSSTPGTDKIPLLEGFIDVDLKDYLFAGIGAAFKLNILDYDVYLKPSLGYLEERVETIASIRQSDLVNPNIVRNPMASSSDSLRGIGPRLGVDVELGRKGPVAVSFVAHTMMSFVLNEREFEFSRFDQSGLPDPTTKDPRLTFAQQCGNPGSCPQEPFILEYDPITVTAGAGLRFTWVGW